MEELLDPNCFYWDSMLNSYLHEFCHTIEMKVTDVAEFHTVLGAYLSAGVWKEENYPEKIYLLNRAVVDGVTMGVPYEYWERKVATVHYAAQEGGYVTAARSFNWNLTYGQNINDFIQYVIFGQNPAGAVAQSFNGWEFVEWSDGVKTPIRQETGLFEDFYVVAIFRRKVVLQSQEFDKSVQSNKTVFAH